LHLRINFSHGILGKLFIMIALRSILISLCDLFGWPDVFYDWFIKFLLINYHLLLQIIWLESIGCSMRFEFFIGIFFC
jgi:hypothetical protein